MDEHLLILGTSARAAAFSALRAGLRPWCADLFADADLQTHCPVTAIPHKDYPQAFAEVAKKGPPGPWMYVGGLENHPELVEEISKSRHLLGNGPEVLRLIRNPFLIANSLRSGEMGFPPSARAPTSLPQDGSWLAKPLAGSGGVGIQPWHGQELAHNQYYFQKLIWGRSRTAIYDADGRHARLVGVTKQLVGEDWLHAGPFSYCGSIGPRLLAANVKKRFENLGQTLAARFNLTGIFGVDCRVLFGVPYVIEVNPRYTASVEVLEYATGASVLSRNQEVPRKGAKDAEKTNVVGKAILFAKDTLVFPAKGPWSATLRPPRAITEMPDFADIPNTGTRIKAGQPVLTFFARATSSRACADQLKRIAADLDRRLFGR